MSIEAEPQLVGAATDFEVAVPLGIFTMNLPDSPIIINGLAYEIKVDSDQLQQSARYIDARSQGNFAIAHIDIELGESLPSKIAHTSVENAGVFDIDNHRLAITLPAEIAKSSIEADKLATRLVNATNRDITTGMLEVIGAYRSGKITRRAFYGSVSGSILVGEALAISSSSHDALSSIENALFGVGGGAVVAMLANALILTARQMKHGGGLAMYEAAGRRWAKKDKARHMRTSEPALSHQMIRIEAVSPMSELALDGDSGTDSSPVVQPLSAS